MVQAHKDFLSVFFFSAGHIKSLICNFTRCIGFVYILNLILHLIWKLSLSSYVRILFVDFSAAFSSIIPVLIQDKLPELTLPAGGSQTSALTGSSMWSRVNMSLTSSSNISSVLPTRLRSPPPPIQQLHLKSPVREGSETYRWHVFHWAYCRRPKRIRVQWWSFDFRWNPAPPAPISLYGSLLPPWTETPHWQEAALHQNSNLENNSFSSTFAVLLLFYAAGVMGYLCNVFLYDCCLLSLCVCDLFVLYSICPPVKPPHNITLPPPCSCCIMKTNWLLFIVFSHVTCSESEYPGQH